MLNLNNTLAAIKANLEDVARNGGLSLTHREKLTNAVTLIEQLISQGATTIEPPNKALTGRVELPKPGAPAPEQTTTISVPAPQTPQQKAAAEKSGAITEAIRTGGEVVVPPTGQPGAHAPAADNEVKDTQPGGAPAPEPGPGTEPKTAVVGHTPPPGPTAADVEKAKQEAAASDAVNNAKTADDKPKETKADDAHAKNEKKKH